MMSFSAKNGHINILCLETEQKLYKKLDRRRTVGSDYRVFAARVGTSSDDLALTSQTPSPTEEILEWWKCKPDATIAKLISILVEMDRLDCVEIVKEDPLFDESRDAEKDVGKKMNGVTEDGKVPSKVVNQKNKNILGKTEITVYIHNVSPLLESIKTPYFNMKFQTETEMISGVCFSPARHAEFQTASKKQVAVNLENFTIKEDSIITNNNVKISEIANVNFPIRKIPAANNISMLSPVHDKQFVSIKAKVIKLAGRKKVSTKDGPKFKLDCYIIDPSGSIQLTLWEEFIPQVKEDVTYNFNNLMVKEYKQNVCLSTFRSQCTITEADPFQESLATPTEFPDSFITTNITGEVIGVDKYGTYQSCCRCNKKLPGEPCKIMKCESCGLTQKLTGSFHCFVQALLKQNDERVMLTFFEEHIKEILSIAEKPIDQLNEDIVIEAFLDVALLKIQYNQKTRIVEHVSSAKC